MVLWFHQPLAASKANAFRLRSAIGLPPQPHVANRGRTLDLDRMVCSYCSAGVTDPGAGRAGSGGAVSLIIRV